MTTTIDGQTTVEREEALATPPPMPVLIDEAPATRVRSRRGLVPDEHPAAPAKHTTKTIRDKAGSGWRHWWYRAARSRTARILVRLAHWDQPHQHGTFTSTGQVVPLIPALVRTRPVVAGPPVGVDLWTRQPVLESAAGLYDARLINGPNTAILGGLGTAKSTYVKATLARSIALEHGRGLVFDRKRQLQGSEGDARGEYSMLAEAVGGTTIRIHQNPKLGTRINILDPAITQIGTADSMLGQDVLLRMVATEAMGDRLTTEQNYALSQAHAQGLSRARSEGRVAVLDDVIQALFYPAQDTPMPGVPQERQREWGLPVALGLLRYTTGDLAGLIDGPTSGPDGARVSFDSPLLVFDTSSLQMGSTALAVTMAITTTFLLNVWVNVPGIKTVVVEEAYSAEGVGAVPAMLRDLAKRARGVGASMVSVFHHLSDVAPGSAMRSLVTEADVVLVFRQEKVQDAEEIMQLLNLDPALQDLIMTLPRGVHIRKRGNVPTTVAELARTGLDAMVTYTDHDRHADA